MSPKLTLRPAEPADADFVLKVTEACLRAYAERTWGRWDEDGARRSFDPATHGIIVCDGEDIGCLEMTETASGINIDKLYILPAYQNRGIGTTIVEEIKDEMRASGRSLPLRALAISPARRFYERLGFAAAQSTQDPIYMEWRPA